MLEVLELTPFALAAVACELVAPPTPASAVALPTLAPPAPSSLLRPLQAVRANRTQAEQRRRGSENMAPSTMFTLSFSRALGVQGDGFERFYFTGEGRPPRFPNS